MDQQKAAVLSGYWPLLRYNPSLRLQGGNPFQLDSKPPSIPLQKYAYQEARYSTLVRSNPEAAHDLMKLAQADVDRQWKVYSSQAGAKEISQPAQPEPVASANRVPRGEKQND
jgi:pyruvate-ferredoxin/flavodoxin oxidoreductase